MVGVDGTCLVVAWYYSGTRGAMVYALFSLYLYA